MRTKTKTKRKREKTLAAIKAVSIYYSVTVQYVHVNDFLCVAREERDQPNSQFARHKNSIEAQRLSMCSTGSISIANVIDYKILRSERSRIWDSISATNHHSFTSTLAYSNTRYTVYCIRCT